MDNLQKAIQMIKESNNIVAFTGAGVSTESNIPDFRSSGGLFSDLGKKYSYPPEFILSRTFFDQHPDLFYDFYRSKMIYRDALPNDSHLALAKLEEMGKVKAVITQNIDGLHQMAGSKNVLELHGGVNRNFCMNCGKEFSLDYIMAKGEGVPSCDDCGGLVKPDVVLYEEPLNQQIMHKAIEYIAAADVLIVMGTSLVVYPAAGIVDYYRGNKLILINKTETPYDSKANVVLHEKAGTIMRQMISSLDKV